MSREIKGPVERKEVLEKVLNLLGKRWLIRGFALGETERVAVARITYY